MKRCASAQGVKREIDAYEEHFSGAPLVIGIDDIRDYQALIALIQYDHGKQIVRMSDACSADFPVNSNFHLAAISKAAMEKPVVWIGAAQSIMFYGQREAEQFFMKLLGTNFLGPVAVLCPHCGNLLESISRNYTKLGHHVIVLNRMEKAMPSIYVGAKDAGYSIPNAAEGFKALLAVLEDGKYDTEIHLKTSCPWNFLAGAMYPVFEEQTPFQLLCRWELGIAAHTRESFGTPEQWGKLLEDIQRAKGLAALCAAKMGDVEQLNSTFGDAFAGGAYERFLCYVCLNVFCGDGRDYLAYCLKKAESADTLEKAIYMAILDMDPHDERFFDWLRQRRNMLKGLDDQSGMMRDFCANAAVKRKDILWYLSDDTEEERAALIHALCTYPYTAEELEEVLPVCSRRLAEYMKPFVFDEYNTKLEPSNAHIRSLLNDYFQRYKLQKLSNRVDEDFVALVEREATERSFAKLLPRSSIVKRLNKQGVKPYFFDALGAEFLSFIQARAQQYHLLFDCAIGHCNVPSITSMNKEFYSSFDKDSILKEDGLDEIKHRGTKYDFRATREPLHLFDELDVLDNDLRKMRSLLASGACEKIVILSDHGASRLAVIYESENDKLTLSEPGKHSGRCCPVAEDPHIAFAAYDNGFSILANYERFKGSRKADVEAHGGATLEETVVPVITLTLKPAEQVVYFPETTIQTSLKDGASIRLFANPPLKAPRMVVNEKNYAGQLDADKHNVVFIMPDIKRSGSYNAQIYDGSSPIAELTFEAKRKNGANPNFML